MGPTWPMGPTIGWKQNRQLGPMHQKSSMTRQLAQLTFHAPSPMSCTLRTISSPFPPLWFGALSQFGGPDQSVMMAILVNRKILVLCNLPDIVNSLRHWMWHYLDIGSFDIARYDGFGRYRLDKKAPQWRQLRAQDSSSWWWLSCCSEPQQRKAALYKPTHKLVLVHFKIYFSLSDMSQRQQAPFRSQLGLELIKMSIRFLPAHGKTSSIQFGLIRSQLFCERPQRGKFSKVLLWTPKIPVSNQVLNSWLDEDSEDNRIVIIKKPLLDL